MSSRARFNAVINWVERPCSSHPWMDSPRWFQSDVQSQHQSAEHGVSCGLPPWGVQSHVARLGRGMPWQRLVSKQPSQRLQHRTRVVTLKTWYAFYEVAFNAVVV